MDIDGKGFSKDPIEGDEASQHRHMLHIFSEHFIKLDPDTIKNMNDGSKLIEAAKILRSIMKVATPLALFAFGLAVFAKSQGWLS